MVGESIESVLRQTYDNTEIIIVDNLSTDNTWEVLQSYAALDNRIRIFRNEENIGPVRNWKRCIDEAKGTYGKILFSDDLISENYIEESLKLFDEGVAFVLSRIVLFGKEKGKTEKLSNYEHEKEFSSEDYLKEILLYNTSRFPVSPAAALFRMGDLKDSLETDIPNPWNLDFKRFGAGNDLLVFLNSAVHYPTIKIAGNAVAYFRFHTDSFSILHNLRIYYDYSKLYFIRKYRPQLLPKFKAVKWMQKRQNLTDQKIYNIISGHRDWCYIVMHAIRKRTLNKYK